MSIGQWWEEWELRVLVLTSLAFQLLLFFSAIRRKHVISHWTIRSFIWVMYVGSDAIPIYALGVLFNRQGKYYCTAASVLELVWVPILLMHFGGQDCITAYNIEDNELWRKHTFTAVSKITVAIYVFHQSWPTSGGDKMLLYVSIFLFIPGILKCLEKPWALKSASINSLVSSSDVPKTRSRNDDINSLETYVLKAKEITRPRQAVQAEGNNVVNPDPPNNPDGQPPQAVQQAEGNNVANPNPPNNPDGQLPQAVQQAEGNNAVNPNPPNNPDGQPPQAVQQADGNVENPVFKFFYHPSQLFVDLASPYADRIVTLRSFWVLIDQREAYASLQLGIYATFDLLYTKIKMTSNVLSGGENSGQQQDPSCWQFLATCVRFGIYLLLLLAMGLLLSIDKKSYDENDVKVTNALLFFTTILEGSSYLMSSIGALSQEGDMEKLLGMGTSSGRERSMVQQYRDRMLAWLRKNTIFRKNSMVAQYSLVGFFARNHLSWYGTMICTVSSFLGCKDFVDKLWCMKPCDSSEKIIEIVIQHVKKGWEQEIRDVASYREFNNRRGKWILRAITNHQQQEQEQERRLKRSFDESVLLWHIATDVCFYTPSDNQYMACCDTSPYHQRARRCREISKYMMYLLFVNPEMLLAGTRQNLFNTANAQLEEILKEQNIISTDEREIVDKLNTSQQGRSQERGGNFFHDAMALVEELRSVSDEEKVWEVIQGVWVEMLCFSASRCRGYLHAKSLGTGGEFLTYVWLLLSHMGMETLPERLQETELELQNTDAAPSSSRTEMELPNVV